MTPLFPPINANDKGKQVQNLHFIVFWFAQRDGDPHGRDLFQSPGFNDAFASEAREQLFGKATQSLVRLFQKRFNVPIQPKEEGSIGAATAQRFNVMLQEFNGIDMGIPPNYPFETADIDTNTNTASAEIEGTIFLEYGVPAANVALIFYTKTFGGKDQQFATVNTDSNGKFKAVFAADVPSSVEVRAAVNGKETSLSAPNYDFDVKQPVVLVAPAAVAPAESEFIRINRDLSTQIGQSSLAGVREDGIQRDLTLLNKKTGWDARVIAVAASTARIARDKDVGLSDQVIYGLQRAGLPSERKNLQRLE